jgi:toxin ParE1/3/4
MARYKIRYWMEAASEVEEAAAWYGRQGHEAVQKWRASVRETLRRIRRSPRLWAADALGIRRVQIKPFPYYVHYGMKGEFIQMFAVAHGSRDEAYWHDRLKNR